MLVYVYASVTEYCGAYSQVDSSLALKQKLA